MWFRAVACITPDIPEAEDWLKKGNSWEQLAYDIKSLVHAEAGCLIVSRLMK